MGKEVEQKAVGADVPEEGLTSSAVENTEVLLQEGRHSVDSDVPGLSGEIRPDEIDGEPEWAQDEDAAEDADELYDDTDGEPDETCDGEQTSKTPAGTQAWLNLLKRDKHGKLEQTLENCLIIFEHDPELNGLFGTNDFSSRIELRKPTPWKRTLRGKTNRMQLGSQRMWRTSIPEPEVRNTDYAETYARMSKMYGFHKSSEIDKGISVQAGRNHFHPARDYFEILKRQGWDGKKRIEKLLIDYFGACDTPFLRAITRKALVAAVTRIFQPGCQFDSILTMYGPQGVGKSMFWSILVGPWFTDLMTNIGKKDAWHELQGVWIVELGELTALSNASVEKIKAFVSRKDDRFRRAYGRLVESHPRQCIFVATTNQHNFLKDVTGNRRFWIADLSKNTEPTKSVWEDLPGEVDQIWAEAYALYEAGTEKLFLDEEMEKESELIQQRFSSYDSRKDLIEEYLNRLLPADWDKMTPEQHKNWLKDDTNIGTVERTTVCLNEIIAEALYGLMSGNPSRKVQDEITAIVCGMKTPDGRTWHRTGKQRRINGYGKQRIFELY